MLQAVHEDPVMRKQSLLFQFLSLLVLPFQLLLLPLLPAVGLAAAAEKPRLVIAHRGASGYLPEHTLEAKVLAFAQGADYIEQDVVMTRDDQLLVFHDLTLERTTNVAAVYPGRARVDGHYYVIDFTLEELRQLQVSEATVVNDGQDEPVYPGRFPPGTSRFAVHTLQEELELLAGLATSTGRQVGIYPELKSPWFHHQHGKDLAVAVLQVLKDFGYDSQTAPVFVQSFDYNELVRVRTELLPALAMDVKLVQLIAENSWGETQEQDNSGNWVPYDYSWMREESGPTRLALVVDGIGPSIDMLVSGSSASNLLISPLTQWAQQAGLQVHPYTFRADTGRLPAYAGSFTELLDIFLFKVGVDGVFTDFPDLAVRFLDQSR